MVLKISLKTFPSIVLLSPNPTTKAKESELNEKKHELRKRSGRSSRKLNFKYSELHNDLSLKKADVEIVRNVGWAVQP